MASLKSLIDQLDLFVDDREPKVYNDDVIALFCQYRKNKIKPEQDIVASSEFHTLSTEIRNYYNKRFLFKGLNSRLTNYQTSLLALINRENKHILLPSEEGICYKLVDFYEQDLQLDAIYENVVEQFRRETNIEKSTWNLTIKGIIKKNTRSINAKEYWFTDCNNRLNLITINLPNPLEKLWFNTVQNQKTVTVTGRRRPTELHNRHYYRILQWELHDA